eukprot:CAMPEP_0184351528 /NCGR_PEP_ID=MMETSP1089-20130417/43683_1 /TAXON_ID=38269 ORGANISM="Gloeochaete wittrockiana, Strain SAG46.84" /NCGR_SAMPLE_ID=MMETSP1089 /ASSEMBLY_ACC=CAM_ASM_000445 /LENGTH=356 /DNA_ID=CAMNT_0026684909 /DNA_START=20 /DNA_END=1090 /DNA_ORIENTATION=+
MVLFAFVPAVLFQPFSHQRRSPLQSLCIENIYRSPPKSASAQVAIFTKVPIEDVRAPSLRKERRFNAASFSFRYRRFLPIQCQYDDDRKWRQKRARNDDWDRRRDTIFREISQRRIEISPGVKVPLGTVLIPVGAIAAIFVALAVSSAAVTLLATILPLTLLVAGVSIFSASLFTSFAFLAVLMLVGLPLGFFVPTLLFAVVPSVAAVGLVGAAAYFVSRRLLPSKSVKEDDVPRDVLEEKRRAERERELLERRELEKFDEKLRRSATTGSPLRSSSSRTFFSLKANSADWTVNEVGIWLREIGMGQHVDSFLRHRIDGLLLPQLTNQELRDELGVTSLGDRKFILAEIESLDNSQ